MNTNNTHINNQISNKINAKFLKPYEPSATEGVIYKKWLDSGFFNPDVCVEKGVCAKDAEKFSIVLPPPNVTGTLHLGHAAMLAIEDIMVRFERMRGKKTLWLPGTDHASIATQSKVEKELMKTEKKSRHDLGQKEFLKRVEKFAQESHDTIVHQVERMGASVDWSREAFTLDAPRNKAVRTAFKRMYDDGLIYRDYRVINWDPKGQTVISDDEVVYQETKALVYIFKYSADFPIAIATTRPETKVGDTAVAVSPNDTRYQKYIGKEYVVEFCDVPLHIKIISDDEVDPEYGTGAVGVTPAHSMIDFEMAKRHNLPVIPVINEYARMTVDTPQLTGKKTKEAREIIVEWLKKENLLEKEEEVDQNISTAERTGCVIEPLPKLQWFIDVDKKFILPKSHITGIKDNESVSLKQLMQTVVQNNQVKILPDRFEKTYFQWIDNLRPWCISRQIWYGHQIPVWYKNGGGNKSPKSPTWVLDTQVGNNIQKEEEKEVFCGVEPPSANWQNEGWEQDPDTLDTWFSSGLWTFSTLGWPEKTDDLKTYHPTDILETAYDIIFFWVARMILMSTYLLGEIPFKYSYFHGLVRDSKGRKMSKSLGNIVDPLEMINKYGADATRMSLIIGAPPGNDTNLSEDKIRAYKKFANKIWNTSRFVLSNIQDLNINIKPELVEKDKKILQELNALAQDITIDLENFRLYLAAEKLYHYFWHIFADKIIEESKERLVENNTTNQTDRLSCQWMLCEALKINLKLLHPFMPFITEEIWSDIPSEQKTLLMVEKWPTVKNRPIP
ncbi:valine--tRNA ligase [Patescibacteria group bacterium]|nr:valine--tRNA ligase [Patescibacteria group bacterium]MBU1519638.1 valine--tRNA ligase [Patescibacteria group bacterium]MBU2009888.1 valine--tRNA ligase [Patescibacteria group bacterium]MBU2416626.1 valine--tRNA ligase [Patescibacteria group bacterium]MBU2461019.1 valine--tRNA ligase [Patescibacteria group bacterium]